MVSQAPLKSIVKATPVVFDPEAAARARTDFLDDVTAAAELADSEAEALLTGVCSASPFLARLMSRDKARLTKLLSQGVDQSFDQVRQRTARAALAPDRDTLKKELRLAKQEAALLIALCDLGKVWGVDEVIGALSEFADLAAGAALDALLREHARAGRVSFSDDAAPTSASGLVLIGMGKWGARELNYSSDIDFCVFFDTERFAERTRDPAAMAAKVTRELVDVLQGLTPEGYVFRTDLRLRPDPGSSAAAISMTAAHHYYEALGQNWERAAYIKARLCAGDGEAGAAFLGALQPFVWRKYLDYAAIEDIHAINLQIRKPETDDAYDLLGRNLKLDRGGIREIEFFAQTQQLILGGRDADLRTPRTKDALHALAASGVVETNTAEGLCDSYDALREAEHRLQMVGDEQTQTLPRDEPGLERIARFSGYADTEKYKSFLTAHLQTVHSICDTLFSQAAPSESGAEQKEALHFTGPEDHAGTLEVLSGLGFTQPEAVSTAVRRWLAGGARATRSQRAREIFAQLAPDMLRAIGGTHDPDGSFSRFTEFLEGLPSGVQLFALLRSNPRLLELIASIVGAAPRVGPHLARHPHVIESLLDADYFSALPERAAYEGELAMVMAQAPDYESALDAARRFGKEESFRIGVHMLRADLDPIAAGEKYADLADAAVSGLSDLALRNISEAYGEIDGALAVLGFGKHGGRELTATSDLDLIFVYDSPPDAVSKGARALSNQDYFARAVRRLVAALSAQTAEGGLYEIDMNLRPSGRSGPAAVRLSGFEAYYREQAWTWEFMALTKARVICGGGDAPKLLTDAISRILQEPRDAVRVARDVAEMRGRIEESKPAVSPFDVKHRRGGLIDVEFVAQYLQLIHAHEAPEVLSPNTVKALTNLAATERVSAEDAATLCDAARLFERLLQILRLTTTKLAAIHEAGPAWKRLVAESCGVDGFEELTERVERAHSEVLEVFNRIIVARAASA